MKLVSAMSFLATAVTVVSMVAAAAEDQSQMKSGRGVVMKGKSSSGPALRGRRKRKQPQKSDLSRRWIVITAP